MLEVYVISLTTFFATVGPLDVAVVFAAMSAHYQREKAKRMALRGVLIASVILIGFAFTGDVILSALGISLAALKVAGGILLLLVSVDMVFARSSGISSTTDEEAIEANHKQDISVFPLATPLLAGPGAMGASILLSTQHSNDHWLQLMVIAAIISIMFISLLLLLLAAQVKDVLGVTGMHVISRIFGVLLCSLAVQFIFNGLRESGLF